MAYGVVGAVSLALLGLTACGGEDPAPAAPRAGDSAAANPTTSEKVEVLDEVTVQRIQYPTEDADPEQNWADLYLPAGEQRVDSIPLVVLIHGGAWQSQLGAQIFEPLARDLAGRGMAVYNVEYRRVGSGGGWPTTFRDVANALDHVTVVDRRFPQLTTDDELVVGHSAGAQLAVWGGTRHKLEDDEVGSRPAFRPTRVVSSPGRSTWLRRHPRRRPYREGPRRDAETGSRPVHLDRPDPEHRPRHPGHRHPRHR